MHIRNTLFLEDIEVSEPCLDSKPSTEFAAQGSSHALAFDAQGNLPTLTSRE
jgi:hypothetical protein